MSIIYAKCIRDEEIAKNQTDFMNRKNEENHVYCVGETTMSKNGMNILYAVLINLILDCLKYGNQITIINFDNHELYRDININKAQVSSNQQYVIDILGLDAPATIDFIFNIVGDASLVHGGYVHFLNKESQNRYYLRKEKCF